MRGFGGVTSEGLGVSPQWGTGTEPLVRGLGVKPAAPSEVRGRVPGQGGWGAKPPEAESFSLHGVGVTHCFLLGLVY